MRFIVVVPGIRIKQVEIANGFKKVEKILKLASHATRSLKPGQSNQQPSAT